MAIMFNNHGFDPKPWVAALGARLPGMEIRVFPQVGDPESIKYAVIWNHPHGDLGRYPNLKAILLLSAGADFLKHDPSLPDDTPIVRLVDEAVARDMAQHCLHFTLHFHRAYHLNARDQTQAKWLRYDYPAAEERRVGILGLGAMGQVVAAEIMRAGFPVHAWVRTARDSGAVNLFVGEDQIEAFFASSDILISILPNTMHTQGFINAERLACMPRGAFLINVGRGETIDDDALKQALDAGHIEAAALDVFRHEPLPAEHWMWAHRGVIVTPHAAGNSYARSGAEKIAANILRLERGETPFPLFDPRRGY